MPRPAPLLLALSYLAFVSLGLPDTVLGVAWPSLRATFGLSQAALGEVLAASVGGYFVSGLVAGRLVGRLGVGGLLAGSSALVTLGLVGYASAPTWARFVPVGVAIGLGSGAIDAALNGYAARHFPVRHLNWLHACYSIGATAGPIAMTAALARAGSWRVGYVGLGAALGAMTLAFVATRRWWEDGSGRPADAGARARDPGTLGALRLGRVWLQIAVFFVYTGLEAGTGAWCFTVLREGRGAGLEAAGAWTSAYFGSIAAGRVVLGFVVDRVGPDRLLRLATLGAVAGATLFAVTGAPVGRLGLVLLGASLAPLYPTLMARTPARLGDHVTPHAVGFQVSAATLGAAVLPASLGVVAANAGVIAVGAGLVATALALLALHEALLAVTGAGTARGRRRRAGAEDGS